MYSPKIRDEHIPALYKIAKSKGIPMTQLINQIIEEYLKREKKMEHIDLDDALNGDWLANLRKMKKMSRAQKLKFIRKMEKIEMITVSQESLDKALRKERRRQGK